MAAILVERRDVPEVSVIIPAYRVTPYIAATLNSVLAQTFRGFETIVVNDGCPDSDNLERVLAPYLPHITYLKQPNGGTSAAKNAGILASRADLVATLDGDDLWKPDYLARQLAKLREDPTVDVLYTDAILFGDPATEGRRFMEVCPSTGEVTFAKLLTQECNVFTSVLAKRSTLIRAGLFDPAFRSSEDFDLWLRVLKAGGRIAYQREPLVLYRRRPASLSTDFATLGANQLAVLDKIKTSVALTGDECALLNEACRRFRANLDLHQGKAAMLTGDTTAAIRSLRQANCFFNSRNIALSVLMLRVAPGLLRRLYRARAGQRLSGESSAEVKPPSG